MKQSFSDQFRSAIKASGKTYEEVARELGYRSHVFMCEVANGRAKLPLRQVGPFARVVNTDPRPLLSRALAEYEPDFWAEIQKVYAQPEVIAG